MLFHGATTVLAVSAFVSLAVSPATAQSLVDLKETRADSNVIYGMVSGLALLMDVHYSAEPNGYGIVFIPGSGWHAAPDLEATPLKEGVRRPNLGANALLDAGYTLFAINHRAASRFRYPAAVEDAERAVRFKEPSWAASD